jgi:hypothetical protein
MKETVQDFLDAAQSLGGAPAGALPTGGLFDVPDADFPFDVWISDGRLVQIELDLVAIAEAAGEEVPEEVDEFVVRVAVEEFTDDVEAPSDFAEIDLQQLFEAFFGASLGGMDSAGAPPVPGGNREVVVPELGLACSDIQMLSPEEIEQFLSASGVPGALKQVRQACPELF